MFKKAVIILLVVFMVVAVGGCGAKERMEEKVAESVVEGLINKAVDGEGKVDLDGDKVIIKGKDGEEFSFGAAEWPESGAAKQIPQLSQGTVVSAMNSDQFCVIILEKVESEDFAQYLEEIKAQGFTNDSYEFTSDSIYSYNASKDENTKISLTYDSESKGVTVNYEISQ
jgi:hypothetical protein